MRRARGLPALGTLVALWVAVYLPGFFTIPVVDRDEARFAQASRQIAEQYLGRAWLVPMVQDRPRLNKPPAIYWAQACSAGVLTRRLPYAHVERMVHDRIWMYRVPSLVASLVVVLATWRLGCSMWDPRVGKLGGALLACSPVFFWEARQARADMVMVALTTLAVWALWEIWKRRDAAPGWWRALWLWACVGAGVMTKGPITPLVVLGAGVSISVLGRSWSWWRGVRPIAGCALVLAMSLPWVWAVAEQVGWERYWSIVRDEVLGRSVGAKEGHGAPPGYHLLLLTPLLGVGCLCTGYALVRGVREGVSWRSGGSWWSRARSAAMARAPEAFALCVVVAPWVVFEASATKLPHYTMPLYPMIALLSARAVLSCESRARAGEDAPRWVVRGGATWIVLVVVYWALGLGVLGLALHAHSAPAWGLAVLGAVLGVGVAAIVVAGARLLRLRRWLWLQRLGCGVFAVAVWPLGEGLGRLPQIRTSGELARNIRAIDPGEQRAIGAVGYQEDSLIYETRGRARRVSMEGLDEFVRANPGALVVMDRESARARADFVAFATVEGFNYSKGRRVVVLVGQVSP